MTSSLLERFTLLEALPFPKATVLSGTSWLHHPAADERQWHSASSLDRYDQLPEVELDVEIGPRRRIPVSWKQLAVCHGMDLTLFFGDDQGTRPVLRRSVLSKAKAICITCPVRRPCLTEALEGDERGIWGGTSRRQRMTWLHAIEKGQTTVEEVVDGVIQASPGPADTEAIRAEEGDQVLTTA